MAPSAPSKRSVRGGFLVDDSDDEEPPTKRIMLGRDGYAFVTCSGETDGILKRKLSLQPSYKDLVAARSKTKEGRAIRAYYGIDIHQLLGEATSTAPGPADPPLPSVEASNLPGPRNLNRKQWTEKYRARSFMDLVGDDYTNRQVLRWFKKWDPIVFPESKSKSRRQQPHDDQDSHRKVLLLTGPAGLGKTTLAHVIARQAGYEVLEINASDDRSRDVVRGRIRTSLGTENIKTVQHTKTGENTKVARPVCVVVDEVDGVTTGAGQSGEGGFIKALMDLVLLDQKNSSAVAGSTSKARPKKKGDDFRQRRPIVLICNDVYHPSLRPLRQSGLAEIIRVGRPSVDAVVTRLRAVFGKEGIRCEKDAARKLCEAVWGMANGIDNKRGSESPTEGDLRAVMIAGEWVAGLLRATHAGGPLELTRQWVDQNVLRGLQPGGGGSRGIGGGGRDDLVRRVFMEGAGFPKQADAAVNKKTQHEQPQGQLGFAQQHKRQAMEHLDIMVATSGEVDRIMTDLFSEYPNREFNDDSYLSKPAEAYDWLHFHDTCFSRLYSSQDWELGAYLSQPVLAFHHLFASAHRHHSTTGWRAAEKDDDAGAPLPFTGPRADYSAHETEKQNLASLQGLQVQLSPTLSRVFRSPESIATEFVPYLLRMVSPDVKPVVVGGSTDKGSIASVRKDTEKEMVRRAGDVLAEVGVSLVKGRIEEANPSVNARPQWVYRLDPDLDMLSTYETAGSHILAVQVPVRYAVRQVLDQELQKAIALREVSARQARFKAGRIDIHEDFQDVLDDNKENAGRKLPVIPTTVVKKDFFGRVVVGKVLPLHETDGNGQKQEEQKVWVTYHEGLNNAVKKPLMLEEFMRGL